MADKILIYGANGYMGSRFAQFLFDRKVPLVLAGRSISVKKSAKELNLPFRIFESNEASDYLDDIAMLINLSSELEITQSPLIEACIKSKCHYMDLSMNFRDVQNGIKYHESAKSAGVVLSISSGFRSVIALILIEFSKKHLEKIDDLELSFSMESEISKGLLLSIMKNASKPGIRMRSARAEAIERELITKEVELNKRSKKLSYESWAPEYLLSRFSSELKNIEVYTEYPDFVQRIIKGRKSFRAFLIGIFASKEPKIDHSINSATLVKARFSNENEILEIKLIGPEVHELSMYTMVLLMELIRNTSGLSGLVLPNIFGTNWLLNNKFINIEYKTLDKDENGD